MESGEAQIFAVRLGYDPVQVRRLVDRMGTDITQNELLSELVKIKGSLDLRTGCDVIETKRLRHIVVDGANIVSNYDNTACYCLPIHICVKWFRERGHKEITVFIPYSWKQLHFSGEEKEMMPKLEEETSVIYISQDEKSKWNKASILKFVVQVDGILVSNDNYDRLIEECPEYAAVVEKRLLMYSFVKNRFMPPDDPLGRMGPTLDKFLQRSLESLKPSGTKAQSRNIKGCIKGQRSNSPKYVKRALSRLHSVKQKETFLPNELIRSNSDQAIKYCSLPSITESPITDLFQNISLEKSPVSGTYSSSSNHRTVVKNISDPSAIVVKDHVGKPLALPGNFNNSLKHQKVFRKINDDFNGMTQDAIYWRNQPAERPFEDVKSNEILRNHFSVPDISYGAINNLSINRMTSTGPNLLYSSTPNFWTTAFTEEQVSFNSRYLIDIQSIYAVRAKLHYHLSAIFPKEQVDTVFRLHPEEINPRELCSAIIRLFPNE